jgi:hypothetical protein
VIRLKRSNAAALVLLLAVPWCLVRAEGPPSTQGLAFRSLHTPSSDAARAEALAWLQSTGKSDEATLRQFSAIWGQTDRPILDRVADVLALGDPEAARLLAGARDPAAPAPLSVPSAINDVKQPAFYRSNLALAYGKALSNRRVYEEALAALRAARPDQVVDPAAYFFHRAVSEHALLRKQEAVRSLVSLTEDVMDVPDRYKTLAMLMAHDMQSWRDKDLGDIARKMGSIERRLELSRGGPETQKMQRDVVARLDEMIKRLENGGDGC